MLTLLKPAGSQSFAVYAVFVGAGDALDVRNHCESCDRLDCKHARALVRFGLI